MSERIHALQKMLEKNPGDARAHFGLAAEYERGGDTTRSIEHLERYLEMVEDQGNAWGRLAAALVHTGRIAEARAAYARGIAQARQHGHPSMAGEFEHALEELDD